MHTDELIKLADLLDSQGEHEAASKIDNYLRKRAEEGEAEVVPEDPTETPEEPESPLPGQADEVVPVEEPVLEESGVTEEALRSALDSFLESPQSFESVNQLKQMIDDFVLQAPKEASLNGVFGKLAGIADTLDTEGYADAADLIDGFLDKYAEDIEVAPGLMMRPEEFEAAKEDLPEKCEAEKDALAQAFEKFVADPSDMNERAVFDFMKQYKDAHAEKEPAVASAKHTISKRALDLERHEEADTKQSNRYDDEYHHNLQVREPKSDNERVDREGRKVPPKYPSTNATSLSTRYCPDHIGEQMACIGPSTYQCPLCNQIFNWETGWTDFDGNEHPGGSVAAQTPESTDYGVPHRVFDSREKVLNVVN